MSILIAPGSYKGTIKSNLATQIIARAVERAFPTTPVHQLVIADGGEGTLETIETHLRATTRTFQVQDPLGRPVQGAITFVGTNIAVIESAQAVGFSLLRPTEMNPFIASSAGLGHLISCALDNGANKILVTMGDSSIMDMGVGMLAALGVQFFDASGSPLTPNLSNMASIASFHDAPLKAICAQTEFACLVDTDDYLCGADGQVQLYGRQKGLADADIPLVEASFSHFAALMQRHLGVDVTRVPRATGSGGVAAAMHAFMGAPLHNTLEYLTDWFNLPPLISQADVVITGEGRLDNQTKFGKVPYFIARRATKLCIGLFGSYTQEGLDDLRSICPQFLPFTLNPEFSTQNPEAGLYDLAFFVAQIMGQHDVRRQHA
jgi:glycerate kinase